MVRVRGEWNDHEFHYLDFTILSHVWRGPVQDERVDSLLPMKTLRLILFAMLYMTPGLHADNVIGFLEDFALAPDRSATLSQLIPGTEDFYYYKALDEQNRGDLDAADATLKQWVDRLGTSARVEELRNRQALLRYPQAPQDALQYLRDKLNLRYDHHRQTPGAKPDLPTALDPNTIAPETLLEEARRKSNTLKGVEVSGLDWVLRSGVQLDASERRDLLARIQRPDVPHLVDLILADLATKESRGFGEFRIHSNLFKSQLDELWNQKPDLINNEAFIRTYLTRLCPADNLDWRHHNDTRRAYLGRLWNFAQKLPSSQNSLKACLFYQRLVFDRAEGVYDRARFLEYVKLPRNVFYIEPRYLREQGDGGRMADLSRSYENWRLFPPIGTDAELVQSYLEHFFLTENSYDAYELYIRENFLKQVFAETKILNGIGDPERWAAMLEPAQFQALKDRVDIEFAYTNEDLFSPDEPVSLKVGVKNVGKLIVKIYEVNALNYYLKHDNAIGTDLDLDGLVANEERSHSYDEPPLRRVERTFDFPELKGNRGTWVIELIGNGRSSRALVCKGELYAVPRPGAAGTVLTVFNENNELVKDAAAWFGGRKFEADGDGEIAIPFTKDPSANRVILTDGTVAAAQYFSPAVESYALTMGVYADREQLLAGAKVKLAVRPNLRAGNAVADPTLLEDVKLTVTASTLDGISTTRVFPAFELFADRESVAEFQMPARVTGLLFRLEGQIKNLSTGKKETVAAERKLAINSIDKTAQVKDVFLSQLGDGWILEVLGRTGERRSDQVVNVELKQRDFEEPAKVSLKTDETGRVKLGKLPEIVRVNASAGGEPQSWVLEGDRHTLLMGGERIVTKVGAPVRLPYMGDAKTPQRGELSLLELRGGEYEADRFDAIALEDGFVVIRGLEPGRYAFFSERDVEPVMIQIDKGEEKNGFVFGEDSTARQKFETPLQIQSVARAGEWVEVKLANAGEGTRVHVVADRFEPAFDLFQSLSVPAESPWSVRHFPPESFYVSGRDIGDEYRYVLERAQAEKFPGNMLSRPGLLLNPWALRETETEVQQAKEGEAYARQAQGIAPAEEAALVEGHEPRQGEAIPTDFSDLEFLKTPSRVLWNIVPDEKGVVRVRVSDLGGRHHVHVLAVDPENTVCRELVLDGLDSEFRDVRLADALDPKADFTQDKTISLLGVGGTLVVKDPRSAEFEVYDSVGKLLDLYRTLSGDATLAEFSFIADWPLLKPEEKREKYSKYACHELSFFLSQRDPGFFRQVIVPYLRNKKDKTFLDHYLLGDDLTDYLSPWQYEHLNIVERVLLGRRLEGELEPTRRMVKELCDLIPPDPERFDWLFRTALRGQAMEKAAGGRGGFAVAGVAMDMAATDELAKAAEPLMMLEEAAPEAKDGARPVPPAARMPAARMLFRDKARREEARPFYQKLPKTKEWAENNYYHRPIAEQDYSLIPAEAFWNDFAAWDGKGVFLSEHVAGACRNFTEMLFALAVTGIPFEAAEHKSEVKDGVLTLTAASPAIVFHKEIAKSPASEDKSPILVSEDFFRLDDRYRYENNERRDKFVTDEFLVDVVYGGQVVVTNPTSAPLRLDLLVQIPELAIPVQSSDYTTSRPFVVGPYATQKIEYSFYFPESGDAVHYPAHVSKDGKTIASAEAFTFHVVKTLSTVDKGSWEYLSQDGTGEEVLEYLRTHNLRRTDLSRIAWRMKDAAFFQKVIALLREQFAYDGTLWSYGLLHNDLPVIRQYLQHADDFLANCGAWLESEPLTIDPVARRAYQFLEYKPLVNARTHRLGEKREIQNEALLAQYRNMLRILSFKSSLDDVDRMSVTYYLLLQDRVAEGIEQLARVDVTKLPEQLQHDYFKAYVAFYKQEPEAAKAIAEKYRDYPVDRWRDLFADVTSQVAEIEGGAEEVVDGENREQRQGQFASMEPTFELKIEDGAIHLTARNLKQVTINYYPMDLELLFSTNPFVGQDAALFSMIRPNRSDVVQVPADRAETTIPLPDEFKSSNVLVEVVGAGQRKALAHYANSLDVQVAENYGRLQVMATDGKLLPVTYVKVYARMKDGTVRYYKDGYTDLRGKFDYTSLNTDELPDVAKFSILILSEKNGALVREASPPQR